MRKYFDLVEHEAFILEIDNDDGSLSPMAFRDARVVAQIANLHANVCESIRLFDKSRFFHLTVVGDEDQVDARGIERGWYVARWISEEDARKLHESWNRKSLMSKNSITDGALHSAEPLPPADPEEGRRLAHAFLRIASQTRRQGVIEMVEDLAREDEVERRRPGGHPLVQ
jgi:hypothetical protein